MEQIDLDEYLQATSANMGPTKNMYILVFRKQAKDMGIVKRSRPQDVDALISRVSSAMEFFVGPKMKKTIERTMRENLRKRAPEYFNRKYGF